MSDLHQQVHSICEEALEEVRQWDHSFQETRRRNGDIIPKGDIRDAVDTGETRDTIVIEPTERGMDIFFAADDAYYVLNKDDSYHHEITGIMVETIAEEVPALLILDLFHRAGIKATISGG